MSAFFRIIIGLLVAGAGVLLVIKTHSLEEFFGPIPWAEAHLGGGGTNLMYKLIGIVIILIGFIVTTNLWNAFLQATLGQIVPNG